MNWYSIYETLLIFVKDSLSCVFQASNQTDLENWITAIHSFAATLLTSSGSGVLGKEEMVQILSQETTRVENKIQSDSKLKKMAELQSTVVTDLKNKQAFLDQVQLF